MTWTRTEDEQFEAAVAKFYDEDEPKRWLKIAAEVPGKSPEEIRVHYEMLVKDVMMIESGRVEIPVYSDDSGSSSLVDSPHSTRISVGSGSSNKRKRNSDVVERKRGTPWTEEEHRLFLKGLEKYGKGDWRSISRQVVMTRKRNSIHDITNAENKSIAGPTDPNSWTPEPTDALLHQQPSTLQPWTEPQASFNSNQGGSFRYREFGFGM